MGDWIGPAEFAWALWGLIWLWRRWTHRAPVGTPPSFRSAMLLNSKGALDSVRTLIGAPPSVIATARMQYRLDRGASKTHWVYRAET